MPPLLLLLVAASALARAQAPSQESAGAKLYLEGRFAEARRALESEAAGASRHFWLGYTLLALGDKPRAAEEFEAFLRSEPANQDVLYALARTYAQLAEMSFQRVFALDPDSARAWQLRGIRYELERQWKEAAAAYKEALRRNPKLPAVHRTLGRIYAEELKEPARGHAFSSKEPAGPAATPLAALLQRRAAGPGDPDVYFQLGEAYADLK